MFSIDHLSLEVYSEPFQQFLTALVLYSILLHFFPCWHRQAFVVFFQMCLHNKEYLKLYVSKDD